ncbi:MAG: hypothetical protein KF823_16305 [Xanthomonadales bacterium]|nr:hypothetical protein [Xanthomonadales bacterium]
MARFPRIDSPCPLPLEAQARVGDHCSRCRSRVVSLDGLDDPARQALLAAVNRPLCVRYSVPRPAQRVAALGVAALGAGLMAGAAFAKEQPDDAVADPHPGVMVGTDTGHPGDSRGEGPLEPILLFVGGVSRPDEATWVDESDLSVLPVVYEDDDD